MNERVAAVRRQHARGVCGSSVLAIAAVIATPAWSACGPERVPFNGTITCEDTDANGLVVTQTARVNVLTDAQVLAGDEAAISSVATYMTLVVDGEVLGGALPGVLVSGASSIEVRGPAKITGSSAITLRAVGGRNQPFADVSNLGTLTGTTGPALVALADTGFNNLSNGGTIQGGISGRFASLLNSGLIDGGSRSAISATVAGFSDAYISNSGRIVSVSDTATMDLATRYMGNEGTIANHGTGAAIATSGVLGLENRSTGKVSTTGSIAIRAGSAIQLTNAGTIIGSVVSVAAAGSNSTIDTRLGTIDGDLLLGAGNDLLYGNYDLSTGRIGSITGRIDGGAGIDTIATTLASDLSIDTFALPTGFERLQLDLANGATVELGRGFTAPYGFALRGNGTLRLLGDLTTTGSAIGPVPFGLESFLSLEIRGTITANLTDPAQWGVDVALAEFINRGTIVANGGNGVRTASSFYNATLRNEGTITASGTAVSASGNLLANFGRITSINGIGALVVSDSFLPSSNDGIIRGATTGLDLNWGTFVNRGTITARDSGVLLQSRASFTNAADGVVTGGTAIALGASGYNVTVRNAGTINGNIDFGGTTSFGGTDDVFIDDGGVVNGSVRFMAGDDAYVTDFGRVAAITGGVDGGLGFDTVRYIVRSSVQAVPVLPTGFEAVDFELVGNSALTLTASSLQTAALSITGSGTADITVDAAQTDRSVLRLDNPLRTRVASAVVQTTDLDVVSRGNLTLTMRQPTYSLLAAVVADAFGFPDAKTRFENAGTIDVIAVGQAYYTPTAIYGGTEVRNSGSILLVGAVGISGSGRVVNSGSIVQVGGSRGSSGITSVPIVENDGTIRVGGAAISTLYGGRLSLLNRGLLESTGATAVELGGDGTIVNEANGTIRGIGSALRGDGSVVLTNHGSIIGDVALGSIYAFGGSTFLAEEGTVAGSIRFGSGADLYLQNGDIGRVTGMIDGGAGIDTFGRAFATSATTAIGGTISSNFERELIVARGADVVVTLTGGGDMARDLVLVGDGRIVNRADRTGVTYLGQHYGSYTLFGQGGFSNEAAIGAVHGTTAEFINRGVVKAAQASGTFDVPITAAVHVGADATGAISFTNNGSIVAEGSAAGFDAVAIDRQGTLIHTVSIDNSGTIIGNLRAGINAVPMLDASLTLTNSGSIAGDTVYGSAVTLSANTSGSTGDPADATFAGRVTLNNSGRIVADHGGGVFIFALDPIFGSTATPAAVSVVNSGTIAAASGDATIGTTTNGLLIVGEAASTATVRNLAGGTIAGGADRSTALLVSGSALDLDNAGTITGNAGRDIPAGANNPAFFRAGAIFSTQGDDTIRNTGTITGSIDVSEGQDRIENRGSIVGNVFLGEGDDTFLQLASASLVGTVDGGAGTDSLVIDATSGGAVNGDQFVRFERFSQVGEGNVTYSGQFRFDTISVEGSTISIAADETVSSDGAVTITGSDARETVRNYGTTAGTVDLAGDDDRMVNNGTVLGNVLLGSGNDTFVDAPGSRVDGVIDGGSGNDLYSYVMAGNRIANPRSTGFERVDVSGSGTLSLTLGEAIESIALSGTGLDLVSGGLTVGSVTGSDASELVTADADLPMATLGGGDDMLSLGTMAAQGRYDGGGGSDRLSFTVSAPVTLSGSAIGFEQVTLAGGVLTITGTLGAAGAPLAFGAADTQLTVAARGTLAGTIDLGEGADNFRLAAGGTLSGSVAGGGGNDLATLDLAGDATLAGDRLTGFETLNVEGRSTLSFAGAHRYDQVRASGNLAVARDASLVTGTAQFGSGDNRLTIAGQFAGSVDGGAGTDSLLVSSGTIATPVQFGSITNVENFAMTGGFATIDGAASLGNVEIAGGRLVGLAGSTIGASQVVVRSGAVFGSAGTVNANLLVAGTLSPGASPGTMTVNGNVALQGGSVALFELATTTSDKLIVNGTLSIASGATLRLEPTETLRAGTSYDLIVASGGITGSFTTVAKPENLLGFVVQRADRIQLLGQFQGSAGFSAQVNRSIDYANATLAGQPADSALFGAAPALLLASGASNAQAFAQLTPEAYASAIQVGVEDMLTLAGAVRDPALATGGDAPHAYTFAQTLGGWRRLGSDPSTGTAATGGRNYGFLAGIGIGNATWNVGAFAGYLNSHQRIEAPGARTSVDGIVAGIHGRLRAESGLGFDASVLYNDGNGRTERALPGAAGASGRYDLRSWAGDVTISYDLAIDREWTARPRAGVTYMRVTRAAVAEKGGSAFALSVDQDRHVAGFAGAGLLFGRSETSDAAFRPWVSFDARYQIEGRRSTALAGYAGGGNTLLALGAQRTKLTGIAAGGVAYRFSNGLDMFASTAAQAGRDDNQETITAGVRLRF